jgi:hypothetical protein
MISQKLHPIGYDIFYVKRHSGRQAGRYDETK